MVFIGHDIDISISSFHMHKCDEFNWHFAELALFFLTLSLSLSISPWLSISAYRKWCACKGGSPDALLTHAKMALPKRSVRHSII